MNRRSKLEIIAPGASPEETAAVIAVLERFMHDTSLASPPDTGQGTGSASRWKRAALAEGVRRAPELPATWQ